MLLKILVDLDVITVALWDKGERGKIGRDFIKKVENKAYYVITSTLQLNLIKKWEYKELGKKIENFYLRNSNEFLDRADVINEIISKNIDFELLFREFEDKGIKEEDITLILSSSVKEAVLVTFNKRHLRNKIKEINNVLLKFSLNAINVRLPDEIP